MKKSKRFFLLIIACLFWGCSAEESQTDLAPASTAFQENSPSDSLLRNSPFSIQVAALSEDSRARSLVEKLKGAGLPAFVLSHSNIIKQTIYRVRVGPFKESSEAQQIIRTVKDLGYAEAFIKNHANEIPDKGLNRDNETINPDELRQLTSLGNCSKPVWSPNGREIAFYQKTVSKQGIYSIGTGGGAVSRVAENGIKMEITDKYVWSLNGKYIAFVARDVRRAFDWAENIYVVDRNGLNQKRVFEQDKTGLEISKMLWSPSGTYLAFDITNNFEQEDARNQEVLILSINSAARPLSLGRRGEITRSIAWLNDKKLLLTHQDARGAFSESNFHSDGARPNQVDIVSYDFTLDQTETLFSSRLLENYAQIDYLSRAKTIVFKAEDKTSRFFGLISLNGGEEYKFYEDITTQPFLSNFVVTGNEEFYFILDSHLWLNSTRGRNSVISLPLTGIETFAVSASGKTICFSRNGDLFSVRLNTN